MVSLATTVLWVTALILLPPVLPSPVNVSHISGISGRHQHVLQDIITNYQLYQDPTCVMGGRSDVIERCYIPVDGQMVPAENDMVRFPKHSSCRLREDNPDMPRCITCLNSAWKTTGCREGLQREKRFFLGLLIGAAACYFFCRRRDEGNGEDDYSPPRMTSCEPPETPIFADRGLTSTTVTWTMPSAVDGKGNSITPSLTQGLVPGSTFLRGYHTVSYKATDSKGFSDYCNFSFEVRVPTCYMHWVRHASRVCDGGEIIHGKKCQLVCDDGYDLEGAAEVTCEQDGSWSSDLPTCKPKTCADLADFTCTDNYDYGSICSLSCDISVGFSVTNPSITICLKTGQWLHPVPQCIDTAAPVFDDCPTVSIMLFADQGTSLTAGLWGDITATDNAGNVTVTQVEGLPQGSMFSGSSVIAYKATDPSGNEAMCTFNVVVQTLTCSPPSLPDNKMWLKCTNDYMYGSECAIGCMGALLNGSNLMTCVKENSVPPSTKWEYNGSTPFCEERPCPDLDLPENGALACDANLASSFCSMHCNDKYDVPHTVPELYVCGYSTGTWRPESTVKDCSLEYRPGRAKNLAEMLYYTGDCGDEDTLLEIKENHLKAMQNSSSFTDVCSGAQCSVENVDVTCGELGRKKRETDNRPRAHKGLDLFRISTRDRPRPRHFQRDPEAYNVITQDRERRATITAVIVKWDFLIPFDCGEMSDNDCIDHHQSILDTLSAVVNDMANNGDFQPTISGYETRVDESYYPGGINLVCGEGMWPKIQTASCAVCPTGMMYNAILDDCSTCPAGSYQDEDNSFACKPCPEGSTSLSEGSRSLGDCLDICTPGHVSLHGVEPCAPCRLGEFHPAGNGTECFTCSPGTTTQTTGATDPQQCLSYELAVEGPCSLTTGNQLSDATNDFTLTLWIKIKSVAQMSIKVTEASAGDQLDMSIGNLISVSVHGTEIMSGITMETEAWTFLALAYTGDSSALTLFRGDKEVSMTTMVTSPVLAAGSTMEVNVDEVGGAAVRSMNLIKRSLLPNEISAMAATCDVTKDVDIVVSLGNMSSATPEKVKVIVPSSCTILNPCDPSPCNDHLCVKNGSIHSCVCQNGFTGDDCSVPPDFCVDNLCENGATCVTGDNNYTCICAQGYRGRLCEAHIVNGGYSQWTEWGTCSVTCGVGETTRSRICDSPPPGVDGDSCVGGDTESAACNTGECQVCSVSQLQQGKYNSPTGPDCNGTEAELNCSLVCLPGYFTSTAQVTLFTCREGVWTPSATLTSCTDVTSPSTLTLVAEVSYTKEDCLSVTEASDLKQQLEQNMNSLPCGADPDCKSAVHVPDCSSVNPEPSAKVDLTYDLPVGNLDLAGYMTTNTVSVQLQRVLNAIEILETTGSELQSRNDIFQVTSTNSIVYNIGSEVNVKAITECPAGSIAESGFCGFCSAGMYYEQSSRTCRYCDKGTYQDLTGQISCQPCPAGKTTPYLGSTLMEDCSESNPHTTDTKTKQKSEEEFEPTLVFTEETTTGSAGKVDTNLGGTASSKKEDLSGTSIMMIVGSVAAFGGLAIILFFSVVIYKKLSGKSTKVTNINKRHVNGIKVNQMGQHWKQRPTHRPPYPHPPVDFDDPYRPTSSSGIYTDVEDEVYDQGGIYYTPIGAASFAPWSSNMTPVSEQTRPKAQLPRSYF
ncbi:sushi, von Willebrand factor type A, EGF and pentraxin domain-containing protein 1-like isoform X2 [Haliotis rufescens]|uniref:sushi, von Willebrand factor type A, EGF and pentraxin domain-containing protein 1-like isoform X2 n=1 Tax=Haliotis rufescens TaxID=6454 RepID=UPI00201ED73C|nr:sushi, von Willebrand factor type A, EGF and pentraxin domain-containing protein 1-like isoform X2 [Haliotis rufescens]